MGHYLGVRRGGSLEKVAPPESQEAGAANVPCVHQAPNGPIRATGLLAHYAKRRTVPMQEPETRASYEAQVLPIGRGSAEHASAIDRASGAYIPPTPPKRGLPRLRPRREQPDEISSLRQRLIAAGLAITLLLTGFGGTASAQQRYRVQPGDTLASVAAEFGVDPEAIRRSSYFSNPPDITAGDIIIIPDPAHTPEEANAASVASAGTSPWTSGVHTVVYGDTLASIATAYGVDFYALLDLNELGDTDIIIPGQRILLPGSEEAPWQAAEIVEETPQLDAYVWVPTYRQARSLSCEYASAYIATAAFGSGVPESAFWDTIPVTLNPHYGYRGNIDGEWGRYDDWGIYAEPLVPVLNAWGFNADAFYSDGDPAPLKAHLDAGHPVVVWLAMWGDTGVQYTDEGTYTVFAGGHVMTAYGYDDAGVYLSDPGTGTYRFYDWETFLWMWSAPDGMSLAIYPA